MASKKKKQSVKPLSAGAKAFERKFNWDDPDDFKKVCIKFLDELDSGEQTPTKASFFSFVGITKQNVYDWEKSNNPDRNKLNEYCKIVYLQLEKKLNENMLRSKEKNGICYMFLMKSTFGYRDRPDTNNADKLEVNFNIDKGKQNEL